ncbi:MSMEG_0570 family nitrogen starvation response protein [Methyloversatilis sp.]|uniref:MSMEG_0570 family nitrogen starvation response protein n=1 Tax=Methyloversatilis sp. TaxID=2569862 RepID=UPI0027338E45|nr:MSMEG_0570 family nitrogen starvation response protein [Methyloversatilis sp.]MDP2869300.1 MSMEG_0570 family nitrogen starvation response protein [Methyloversatilis sp.]MDP3290020.1 MSMEG_0570 family nitrogen starvation response protein [Methyloversatilis sp.]MDP3456885.1 MSMEG_0570 family nitrogen starvation response protein [Methyloversatilis sp.]MDP3580105.1 MSMEG_0570 family nitrogen starvation response protein [Methyloversatilis sp.]
MPAMHFRVRWPDQTESRCYSPSLVIKDYFAPGTRYPLAEFMPSVREALHIASERVRAKYGFACSAALDQLADIEQRAAHWAAQPDAQIEVLAFDE